MDGGNYIKEGRDSAKSTCLMFSPKEEAVGALANCLKLFEVQYHEAYDYREVVSFAAFNTTWDLNFSWKLLAVNHKNP